MQLNVEYWFRLFYNCIRGDCYGDVDVSEFFSWITHLWNWITGVGYALSVIGLFIIVYATMRLFELRAKEKELYSTLVNTPATTGGINPRWLHIESLAKGTTASEWKEAIIEADIMLDDALSRNGYVGEGVGEKLKSIDPKDMKTLNNAWEAHKVRNQIAHEGSEFKLSDIIANRTIARYESVFRELKEI